jgi:hypothetical protein
MSTYTELATNEERAKADLVIIECSCGFHSGWDNSYLEQVKGITTTCPSCGEVHYLFGGDDE